MHSAYFDSENNELAALALISQSSKLTKCFA